MDFPKFKYHPDPIKTGSIVKSETECICCGKKTGYIYIGPVYCEEEIKEEICPWCIADGSAAKKFDAELTDYDGIGNYGDWDDIPEEEKYEITSRTPGFIGWQQERWWTHCESAAAFLGAVGKEEAIIAGEDFLNSLKEETGLDEKSWNNYLNSLHKDNGPTGYLFRCTKCGKLGGYSDCH